MLQIQEAIIVEGKYDKIALSGVCDALVVPTYGFSIFTDTALLEYIRTLAEKRGVIILMDSDRAGFKIRSFLAEKLREGTFRHAYIPALPGKEKRKVHPSAEGTLGVEGLRKETLLEVLKAVCTPCPSIVRPITKLDFYEGGLIGGDAAAKRRGALAAHLSLPPRLSTNALLSAANALMSFSEYCAFLKTLS